MNEDKKKKYIQSFAISAIISVVMITVFTIGGELYKPFKNSLKDIFSHHWIGKGVISFGTFLALGTLLSFTKIRFQNQNKLIGALTAITAFCALAIIVFYFYEFFFAH